MAGDDHPDKNMVAASESSKGKGKAMVEEVENEKARDVEISGDIPAAAETVSIEVPPVKKTKMINADESVLPAPPSTSPPPTPAVAPPQAQQLQVPCPLCHRVFDSYPAMFGHQRVHKERTYRGAYPPPTFQREGSPRPSQPAEETEEAARHAAQLLLDMSQGRFETPNPNISIKVAGDGSSARGVSVDLNVPLEHEKSTDEDDEATEKGKSQLDLNKSPSRSE